MDEPVLLALASLATRIEDADRALDEVLRVIATALGAEAGTIALLNPDSGNLDIEAQFSTPIEGGLSLPLGQGLPGWVAWHGKPVLAGDVAADHRYRPLRPGVRSEMAVPLLAADGQTLGVICLDRLAGAAFLPADLDRLERLGEEACRVMQRIWELHHLRGKARQLETLLATGQSLVSKLEQQELLDTLTRDTRWLMQGRVCALYLYDAPADSVRLASAAGADLPAPAPTWPADTCLVTVPIRTRRVVAFADVQLREFHELSDLPAHPGLRSALAAPLAYEGEVLGVLVVFLDRIHRFDNDEKRLCQALASLGAVALQNARLYSRVFQSEEALRKNERLTMLGLIAAEIAHEIRNPLTVLKLLQGGLGHDFAEGDPRRTDLRVIGEKLDQLETIVTRVLNFGRPPSSLHTRHAVADIIDDTLVLVRLKLAQAKVQVRYEPPAQSAFVSGHKGQLQQVLPNLFINAIEAMPEGGEITLTPTVGIGPAGPIVTLTFTDTGTGVPDALRERLFDSFLSGRPDGTGLGLAIVKRLLASHNGDIVLAQTGPGGTTFRLTLPLAKS